MCHNQNFVSGLLRFFLLILILYALYAQLLNYICDKIHKILLCPFTPKVLGES